MAHDCRREPFLGIEKEGALMKILRKRLADLAELALVQLGREQTMAFGSQTLLRKQVIAVPDG